MFNTALQTISKRYQNMQSFKYVPVDPHFLLYIDLFKQFTDCI